MDDAPNELRLKTDFDVLEAVQRALRTRPLQIGTAGETASLASALVAFTSVNKGIVLPRMTTTQRNNIVNPVAGLEIYNTTTNKLNVYTGSAWEAVTSS